MKKIIRITVFVFELLLAKFKKKRKTIWDL